VHSSWMHSCRGQANRLKKGGTYLDVPDTR
jgi:hypothetical protein